MLAHDVIRCKCTMLPRHTHILLTNVTTISMLDLYINTAWMRARQDAIAIGLSLPG